MRVVVSIRESSFDMASETNLLTEGLLSIGAVVTFSGQVRDISEGGRVYGLLIEHYPGMTEKSIREIIAEAGSRWTLESVRVLHRVGHLLPGDGIVYVGVASQHRMEAFSACEFIMDYLKTRAPFWKKEAGEAGDGWLEQRESDKGKAAEWQRKPLDFL